MSAAAKRIAPVTLADVLEEVRRQRDEVRQLRELVERLLPAPAECEFLTISEAAALVHRSEQAIRARCRRGLIGAKVRGTWHIDKTELLSFATYRQRHRPFSQK